MLEHWINFRKSVLKKNIEDLSSELETPVFILNFFEEGRLKLSTALYLSGLIQEKYHADKSFFDHYYNRAKIVIPETGQPITIAYHRNLAKADNMGTVFGQHLEPAGEYISFHEPGSSDNLEDYEYGTITFKNPLVIPFETAEYPQNGNFYGWKSFLYNTYQKKGKALSAHLISLGYDGIITIGAFRQGSIGEIVNLKGHKF